MKSHSKFVDPSIDYKRKFEQARGAGKWELFCQDVYDQIQPKVILKRYPTIEGNDMTWSTYSLWSARAKEVRPREMSA